MSPNIKGLITSPVFPFQHPMCSLKSYKVYKPRTSEHHMREASIKISDSNILSNLIK